MMATNRWLDTVARLAWWYAFLAALVFPLYVAFAHAVEYHTTIAKTGFYVHTSTGCVFFLSGILQFSKHTRQNHPKLHRYLGYIYYAMVIVTSPAVILILLGGAAAKEAAVISTITFMPIWLYFNWRAYRAILKGDVVTHERFNLRSFNLAFAIVLMRPAVFLINWATRRDIFDVSYGLKTALWWAWTWILGGTELFLYFRGSYGTRTVSINGRRIIKSGETDLAVKVLSTRLLNQRTVELQLECTQSSQIVAYPGQHVSLTAKDMLGHVVTRPYTIVSDGYALERGRIDLVVRLVNGGAMSDIIQLIVNDASVPIRFRISLLRHHFRYEPNSYSRIVLLAGGTGLTPMINIVRAITNNPEDKTKAMLVFINGKAEDVFYEEKLRSIEQNAKQAKFKFVSRVAPDRITVNDIRKYVGQVNGRKVGVMTCGPRPFMLLVQDICLNEMNLPAEDFFGFGLSDR